MEVIGPIIIPVVMVTVNDGSIVHRRRVPSKNSVIKIAVVSYYYYVLSCMLYIVLSKTRFAVFVAFGPHRGSLPIPQCICLISHNAPFRTEMRTFLLCEWSDVLWDK